MSPHRKNRDASPGQTGKQGTFMKAKWSLWLAALSLSAVFSGASATVLHDSYNGSNGHNYGDVVANPGVDTFNVEGLTSSIAGNRLTVSIYTNFAGHAGVDSQYTTNHTGIGYGDLFLSTGWSPYGSGNYNSDNAANGNHWTYAFSLDDPLNNTGGNGTIYALGAGNSRNHNPDALLSDHFINCSGRCTYRNGQEVAVNKNRATATSNTGSWSVGDGVLNFSFDLTGLDLDPEDLGFHWTMYCGNDVIEGLDGATVTSVPEPGSWGMFVLGLGLISLGVLRQRKAVRK
ncbi:PEP-CTERM sorting domain-containing protein [Oleiagrimonas sp. C23AA]|uniref:PEP-CTERM sorting domain-containing protein n=1 Tax=Oleiagrimonas sp. C23AA TaxID=2719047 RepID=UPI00142069E6|nr:PEP-CTERM sorting domain-containing protein [Oleiagrimonas sp. C23AA]NII09508.1 PEP-CTERM sorting domain-containing protein [Oleiagrimonas sp. C23AA]